MKNKDNLIYFIAFGPIVGIAAGIILSLFFRSIQMVYFISAGTTIGFAIGTFLYSILSSRDEK